MTRGTGMRQPTLWRGRWRRLALGLPTIFGWRRRGYFIPSRYAITADAVRYTGMEKRLRAREPAFRETLRSLDRFADPLLRIDDEPPPAPRWEQDWFPRLDAAVAYATVRERCPSRIIEVGAGHSTRFFCRAVADAALETSILSIDPSPRAALEGLPRLTLRREPVQAIGAAVFADLAAGDVLSIDSSHVLMPGSDVDFLINRVLPILPAGVHVQIHDIFLPDSYPSAWGWRGYNEQTAIAALVLCGGWRIDFAAHYVVTRMAGDLAQNPVVSRLPLPAGAFESALWLTRL